MNELQTFSKRLAELKIELDNALQTHVRHLKKTTAENYTPYSAVAVDAYSQVLERGGKRIRGALTIVGYEMCGGKNHKMILEAACAIEMTHAYILVMDDIMDKSKMRRGGPSAHMLVANYHAKQGLSGEHLHFGEAIAINAALIGHHYAEELITQLDASGDEKLKALSLLNNALVVTGHGQVNDLFNEVLDVLDEQAVNRVLEWKTAHYSFLNPLQFGMALAGTSDSALSSITDYCMDAGRAFQITDDILGTFGTEIDAGKSPMDDIREGKRTLLTLAALEKADNADKNFLIQMLGNEKLTQVEFARCKEIILATGAVEEASKQAEQCIARAKQSLKILPEEFQTSSVDFLDVLVSSFLYRTS